MMEVLPVVVPVIGVFLLQCCVGGCIYSRTLNRLSILETRVTELNNELYRKNMAPQVVVQQPRTLPYTTQQAYLPQPPYYPPPPAPPLAAPPTPSAPYAVMDPTSYPKRI